MDGCGWVDWKRACEDACKETWERPGHILGTVISPNKDRFQILIRVTKNDDPDYVSATRGVRGFSMPFISDDGCSPPSMSPAPVLPRRGAPQPARALPRRACTLCSRALCMEHPSTPSRVRSRENPPIASGITARSFPFPRRSSRLKPPGHCPGGTKKKGPGGAQPRFYPGGGYQPGLCPGG